MDYEKSLKETIKDELKKLSSLTWGQRLGYIWDYYKPLMAAAVVLIIVISIVVTVVHNVRLNRIFNAYLVNCNSYETDPDLISGEFAEYIGGIGSNDQITVDTTLSFNPDEVSEYSMAGQMKMTALLAAGEIDLMILDENAYRSYPDPDVFQELSSVYGGEQLAAWKDYLVEGPDSGENAETWFAVDVRDSPVLARGNSYGGQAAYAVVVPGTEHLELCAAFINYLLGL